MAKKKEKKAVKVFMPVMLDASVLRVHETNSNKQSKQVRKSLKENILEEGFDENLIVRPSGDGFYEVVSGNHRYLMGREAGMDSFPCVIRDDWDEVKAELQSVRRNYSRGKIDKDLFTIQVNRLAAEHGLLMGDIMQQMGIEDADKFAELYREEREQTEQAMGEATMNANTVKMIDDLGSIISAILSQYGDTVPSSFIVFPAGQKNHMLIASNPSLKRTIEQIAIKCHSDGLDINIALAGLLMIGMSQSNFIGDISPKVKELGSQQFDGNSDIEEIK